MSVELGSRDVILEQPLVALGDRRSGPLAVDVLARLDRIGERPIVEARQAAMWAIR